MATEEVDVRGTGRGSGFQSSQRGVKNLNPTGPDGKILTDL